SWYLHLPMKVAVDAVIFRRNKLNKTEVLLILRKNEPFEGQWALPGGFVNEKEPLEIAAARELEEETGLKGIALRQLHTFGEPDRDPRGRTISIAFVGFTKENSVVNAADDAAEARWFNIPSLPRLAFDHMTIVETALQVLPAD